MRVLVTGGCGYVGRVLVHLLVNSRHTVRVVDIGWFGMESHPEAETLWGDITRPGASWFEGVDAVIHLAGISNDPVANFRPDLNYHINAAGTAILAHAAQAAGVPLFVYASSCSVYGHSTELATEEDTCKPSYPYGVSKLMGERAVQCLESDGFRTIILRKGTVVGWSPRMRYDLVVNTMVKDALLTGIITVRSPHLWRPILDVRDAARAYVKALESEDARGIFNVAGENHTIEVIGAEVAEQLRQNGVACELRLLHERDPRSYRVDTRKAMRALGFVPFTPLEFTVLDILHHIRNGDAADLTNPHYSNIAHLQEML